MNKTLYKSMTARDESDAELHLNYYVLADDGGAGFGLQVSRMDDKNNEVETARVMDVSHSRSEIKAILSKISKGLVTPFSLNEVIFELPGDRKYDIMENLSYLGGAV
jgi:hypothetical protein